MNREMDEQVSATDSIEVAMSTALWSPWAEVAIEREDTARAARAELVAQHRYGVEYTPKLFDEMIASMVAVAAAAHALDALYGQLATAEVKAAGPKDESSREAHIRECLKARFHTGKQNTAWAKEFQWLFDLRDAAVHARVVSRPSVPHPSGACHCAQEAADYSADAAIRAVDLVADVLSTCASNPRSSDLGAVEWAKSYGPGTRPIITKRDISRDARPLIRVTTDTPVRNTLT